LRGPSGTGKELFAHAIHNASERANQSFISVNCAALPETILESELFGYTEGAFTGARKGGKHGLLAEANKGTLFLDEIGKMSLNVQSKFLRFLQNKEVTPVGGSKSYKIDTRIIAATNLDLEELIEKGEFLSDLYYRLNVVPIIIPPLKEHLEDLPEIASIILMRLNQEYGRVVEEISPDAMKSLQKYNWPGNVRELENIIGRSLINMEPEEKLILPKHIPVLSDNSENITERNKKGNLNELVDEYEKSIILNALERNKGNKTKTAKDLGISIRALYYKMERYGKTGSQTF
jgi:transcriptional regulator with PAS, ATPase and Fis domain